MKQLLKKIIANNIGKGRYLMALIGLGLGVVLVLSAVQLNRNFSQLLQGEQKRKTGTDFLVVRKKVDLEMMKKGKEAMQYSNDELAELKAKPFIKSVGKFTPSQFDIYAEIVINIKGATDLTFEAIPDKYLDVQPDNFIWDSNKAELPVIVYAGLLDFYNTFAMTRSDLPALSQEALTKIPLKITTGSGANERVFNGRIVGFSNRVQSMLVPQSFMDWGNAYYNNKPIPNSSNIIIETDDASNPELVKFLDSKKYDTNKDYTRFGKYKTIVKYVVNIIGFIGAALLVFSIIIFGLFIQLVVSHARNDIQLLTTLGTGPKMLKKFLLGRFVPGLFITVLVGLVLVGLLQIIFSIKAKTWEINLSPWPHIITLAAAAILCLVLILLNNNSIAKALKNNK
jgi:ABC-type antimicrobial peptide transport system permease subunit